MRVQLKDVKKRFGKVDVLKGISADIPSGQRLALIGPNGSGKSTLIRCLLGLLDCDGEILLDGASPFAHREQVTQRLAYVPQVAPQLSASVCELLHFIEVTRGLPRDRVGELAGKMSLDVKAIGDRPFRALSGGMKQKLLLSAALAAQPKLVVLDEPTASLDAQSRDRFFELFALLPADVTLILCSHRLEELQQLAGHVLALEEGKVAHTGAAHTQGEDGRSVVEELLAAQRAREEAHDAQ